MFRKLLSYCFRLIIFVIFYSLGNLTTTTSLLTHWLVNWMIRCCNDCCCCRRRRRRRRRCRCRCRCRCCCFRQLFYVNCRDNNNNKISNNNFIVHMDYIIMKKMMMTMMMMMLTTSTTTTTMMTMMIVVNFDHKVQFFFLIFHFRFALHIAIKASFSCSFTFISFLSATIITITRTS